MNQIRDDFLARASHELRTPLTSIMGNAELIQRSLRKRAGGAGTQKGDTAQNTLKLENIIHQAQRMNSLVDEMLDITSIRSEVLILNTQEHVDIVELTRQLVEECVLPANRPTSLRSALCTLDGPRIEQVLHNLVSNAIKYSPPETPIFVGIERRSDDVVVWVRDQGAGISEEEQQHIFERFYRVQDGKSAMVAGLGLGLYIASQIVDQHGGRMWLESTPGDGSTFYFSLPLEK